MNCIGARGSGVMKEQQKYQTEGCIPDKHLLIKNPVNSVQFTIIRMQKQNMPLANRS
jgi:hypothetical protein